MKIDETLDEKENRIFWKSEGEYGIINHFFRGPCDVIVSPSESFVFLKMHPGSIHTTYWFAFCRRKLRADVMAAFPTLGTDEVSVLVPAKEELSIVKLYAHRGDAVTAYVSGGNPVLFELEKNLHPTGMATGWRRPCSNPA